MAQGLMQEIIMKMEMFEQLEVQILPKMERYYINKLQ